MLTSFFGGRDRLTKLANNPDKSGFLRELATTEVDVTTSLQALFRALRES